MSNIDNLNDVDKENNKFPKNFKFGASTSAYQVEGGWDSDGRGPCIWDTFIHEHPELIKDMSNGDVAADSYNRFEQDLHALKELKVHFYRFSISWTRILPTGDASSLNKAGIDYYNNIIDNLIENKIEPMVTMHHFDLPEELQKIGGLANPLFIQYFEKYADILYSNFGSKVKFWITINEPYHYCVPGYGGGTWAPLVNAPGIGEYLAVDHLIKAHALAYHLYKKKYFNAFKGKVGISVSGRYYYSKENNNELVDKGMQYMFGWITHPIFSKDGGYPEVMVKDIYEKSLREGRAWSRLPMMNEFWKNLLKGSADFLGLNYYTSRYVESDDSATSKKISWECDSKIRLEIDPKWIQSNASHLYCVPNGLGDLLRWIKNKYSNIEVYITENGWSDGGELDDDGRVSYITQHLSEVLKAINNDGCNISGYTVWSLIDNFEWVSGYTEKFGLYHVNFESPTKERTPKKSAKVYRKIIETREIQNL